MWPSPMLWVAAVTMPSGYCRGSRASTAMLEAKDLTVLYLQLRYSRETVISAAIGHERGIGSRHVRSQATKP